MLTAPDFGIASCGPVSDEFLKRNTGSFAQAADFVKSLPYGRNADKEDLLGVFSDGCGTCSTKHALLKKLADENGFEELQLMLGLFRMNASNTPEVAHTLQRHQLAYIPEAHNYLKFGGQVLDYTYPVSKLDFVADLIEETAIAPQQITDFKVAYHRQYLADWLGRNPHIRYSPRQLWDIREQCIKDLSATR